LILAAKHLILYLIKFCLLSRIIASLLIFSVGKKMDEKGYLMSYYICICNEITSADYQVQV
jgi:hypothetical protein